MKLDLKEKNKIKFFDLDKEKDAYDIFFNESKIGYVMRNDNTNAPVNQKYLSAIIIEDVEDLLPPKPDYPKMVAYGEKKKEATISALKRALEVFDIRVDWYIKVINKRRKIIKKALKKSIKKMEKKSKAKELKPVQLEQHETVSIE